MKKFLVIYSTPEAAADMMKNVTPEEMQAGMEPWYVWAKRCGEGLVDLGSPLGNGRVVTSGGSAPSGENVAGYSMLQAEDSEAAIALVQDHPHLGWTEGCAIEVYECMPLPG